MKHCLNTLLTLAVCLTSSAHCSPPNQEPNVLFIAVDDLRPELGCYGNGHIQSPNIDSLAQKSVVFTRAYCQQAVCNPSRVSLLTGLRPDSTQVWDLVTKFRDVRPDVTTLPQHFKQNGYRTLGYGKIFHNPWPDNISWSEPHQWPRNSRLWSVEAKEELIAFQEELRQQGKPEKAIKRLRAKATEIVDCADNEHIDGAIADQTIAAMNRLTKQDQPFFLAAGFVRPHLPFVVPRKYWDLYERNEIPVAKNDFLPQDAPEFAMNTMYELRDYHDYLETQGPLSGPLTEDQQRELKHGYYASVSFVDAQIGRLLAELERLQLREKTIIVLWGDHGWKLGEHGSWCKQTNYEIDTRVPLLIHVPDGLLDSGLKGRVCDAVVESLDVYPTLCELNGISIPENLEGESLAPLLKQPRKAWKNRAVSQFSRRDGKQERMGYALRTERYRYIEWLDRNSCETVATELYDHKFDPQENRNISGSSDHKKVIADQAKILWSTISRPQPGDIARPNVTKNDSNKTRPVLRFRNRRAKAVELFWLAPDGRRVSRGLIKPRWARTMNTTLGHRFQIDNEGQIYTVTKQNETIVLETHSASNSEEATQGPPNILFLMGDDWSWPHAGFLGDSVVKTPTFDRLAKKGIVFERAFVSSPSCTPSRFSIVTGQYHWRLGDGANLGGSLKVDVPVYPDLLKDVGYHVGYSRKGAAPSKHVHRGNDPFGPNFKTFADFLKARKNDEPFCYWYGAGEPHRPYRFGSGERKGIKPENVKLPKCLPDHDIVRRDMCDYYADIQRFDRDSGAMIQVLEDAGELENTLIVISGDNGMPFPRCKATLYDTGTRVPLVIHWPNGVHGHRRVSEFVSLTDLAPTFLEVAGVKIPDVMTGRSLLPLLRTKQSGQMAPERSFVLTGMERHVYEHPSRAIRTENFLYVLNFDSEKWPTGESEQPSPMIDFTDGSWPSFPGAFSFNVDPSPTKQFLLEQRTNPNFVDLFSLAFGRRSSEELYDLKKDPQQVRNIVKNPAYATQLVRLRSQLKEALRETKDPRFKEATGG